MAATVQPRARASWRSISYPSPRSRALIAIAENTMPTMPNGVQQHTVDAMDRPSQVPGEEPDAGGVNESSPGMSTVQGMGRPGHATVAVPDKAGTAGDLAVIRGRRGTPTGGIFAVSPLLPTDFRSPPRAAGRTRSC